MKKITTCNRIGQHRIRFLILSLWALCCTLPKGCRDYHASVRPKAVSLRSWFGSYGNLELFIVGIIDQITFRCWHRQWQYVNRAEFLIFCQDHQQPFVFCQSTVTTNSGSDANIFNRMFIMELELYGNCSVSHILMQVLFIYQSGCSISKCLSVFGWKHLTPATTRFLVQNVSFRAIFRDFLGSNSSLSFVTEAGLKFSKSGPFWQFCNCRPSNLNRPIRSNHSFPFIQMTLFHPTRGIRIGEANNPGPDSNGFTLKCCLMNPTSIFNKVEVVTTFDCQIIQLAENSATAAVQIASQQNFRAKGYSTHWSPPVAAHSSVAQEECTYRGQATGVSIHSLHPLRSSRVTIPEHVDHTRILSSIVQLGDWKIHFVTIYGYPSCHQKARDRTNALLEAAAYIIEQVNLPSVIAGDFNHPLDSLVAGQTLERCGFINLQQKFRELYQTEMPKTCREATSPDQVLLSPDLQGFVNVISVDKQKNFADHDPIVYQLHLPFHPPMRTFWKLPHSWLPFQPDPYILEEQFVRLATRNQLPLASHDDNILPALPDALELWARVLESAVDETIKEQHKIDPVKFPQKHLPKNCRGRAQPRCIKKKPFGDTIKNACQGQYDPPGEASNIQLKLIVRQTRRVQSLFFRMNKLYNISTIISDEQLQQLHYEWSAISHAKGFGRSFPHWCSNIPEINVYPIILPSLEYLLDLSQFLKIHADQLSYELQRFREAKSKYHRSNMEIMKERSKISKAVKGSLFPMVESLQTQITTDMTDLRNMNGLVEIDIPPGIQLRMDSTIKIGDSNCDPVEQQSNTVTLVQRDADEKISITDKISQTQWTHHPYQVACLLNEFWDKYWNRDKHQPPLWDEFYDLLHDTPELDQVDVKIDDPKLWKMAAKMMKSRSARGVDGFLVDELKSLPDSAFLALSQIFARSPAQSFGQNLAQVITLPLAKGENSSLPSQTRPITLVAILYRLWAKITTMQVLQQWQHTIPDYIIGFLPGRSPELEMIRQQHMFEKLHAEKPAQPGVWQGVTLDLVKCFNLIGRLPAALALKKSGVPAHLVDTWYNTLQQQTRLWKVHSNLFKFEHTATGTPEGDSWSVLACIALSRMWAHQIVQKGATPSCYADNWSLKSQQTPTTEAAIRATIQCANAFKLLIDWNKTWCWRTSAAGKQEWKAHMQSLLPEGIHIQIVSAARELGYTMAYNKVQSRQTQRERHDDAIRRVLRLRKVRTSLQVKAQICADACLHKALFATTTYHVGNPWLKELRSLIAKTLVPDRKNSNPYLATQLLSAFVRDPELHLIVESIRCIRRFLFAETPEQQKRFLHFASRHTGLYHEVFGPAGALRSNLLRIGWQIDKHGWLITDSQVQFHLLQDNLPDIVHFLEHSWMKHVMQCRIGRQNWQQFPVPDRVSTLKIFTQLPPNQQQVLATQLTGAYMMGDQRSHIADANAECALCGQEENIHHRILGCPQLQHVRVDFPQIVEYLEAHHNCHLYLPVVFQHEDFEFNTWIMRQLPEPVLLDDVLQQAQNEIEIGIRPTFWTDGSCNSPRQIVYKRAAYGIVYHPHVTTPEIESLVRRYCATLEPPTSFQVVGSAACHGTQSVPRAEMQAILSLITHIDSAIIYTDSQYVLDQASKLGSWMDLFKAQKCPNFDLVRKLWDSLQSGDFQLKKVKAHALNPSNDSSFDTFVKIGNEVADTVAKQARNRFEQQFPPPPSPTISSLDITKQNLEYRYTLQCERSKLHAARYQTNRPLYASKTFQDQLLNLCPSISEAWTFTATPDDLQAVQSCLWGTQYSMQILKWLETLRWPSEHDPSSVGITWYELACNFLIVTQQGIVINEGGTGRTFQPRRLSPWSNDVLFSKQVFSFERAITSIQSTVQRTILPMERTIAKSIRYLGLQMGKSGLARRPMMLFQDEMINPLLLHFSRGEIPAEVPQLPIKRATFQVMVQPDDLDHQQDWTRRVTIFNRFKKRRHLTVEM